MSWKSEIKTPGDKDFVTNRLRFATEIEAQQYQDELLSRWFVTILDKQVSECDDEVNYVFIDGQAKPIKKPIEKRTLRMIAREIRKDWKNVWFGAAPYLEAMSSLESIEDTYGCDTGKSIVLYFLSNAAQWKGEKAREIKKELKQMIKESK